MAHTLADGHYGLASSRPSAGVGVGFRRAAGVRFRTATRGGVLPGGAWLAAPAVEGLRGASVHSLGWQPG